MHNSLKAFAFCYLMSLTALANSEYRVASYTQQLETFTSNTNLEKEDIKKSPISLKSSLSGLNREDLRTTEELIEFRNDILAKSELGPGLKGSAQASINFSGGHSQGFRDQIERRNGFFVEQALLTWDTFKWLELGLGARKQSFLYAKNFVSEVTFPSFSQGLVYDGGFYNLGIFNQQAIVTSTLLNTRTVEKEQTPTFRNTTFYGNYATQDFSLGGQLTFFAFNDLTTQVAYDSSLIGNSTIPLSSNRNQFKYEFQGINTALEFAQTWTYPLALTAKWSFTQNDKAPSGRNKAQAFEISPRYHWRDYHLIFAYTQFVTQSDASPAYFTDAELGHNNRKGYQLMGAIKFIKVDLALKFSLTKAEALTLNPNQDDETRALLTLETNYVAL